MNKILTPILTILSMALVLGGSFFLFQAVQKDSANATGTVSYNETWTATGGVYGYFPNPGYYTTYMTYNSGIPSAGTYCGYGYGSQSSYGFASCTFSPTQWSVTGTINSGTTGVKRYFVSQYGYYYSQVASVSSSACNNDPNNPGGFYHVYFNGASQTFVSNGTTVQGPYGTGIAGQDNYIGNSTSFWSTRAGEYSYLLAGRSLGGMTYNGVTTGEISLRILCVED